MASKRDQGWRDFLTLCQEAKSAVQLDELFQLLLTNEERSAIGLRVELIDELLQGKKTQREIAAELEISIAKITRGSNALKIIPESLKRFLVNHLG